jgi:hypothetical protein
MVLLVARVTFAYSATVGARGDIRNFFVSDQLSGSAITPRVRAHDHRLPGGRDYRLHHPSRPWPATANRRPSTTLESPPLLGEVPCGSLTDVAGDRRCETYPARLVGQSDYAPAPVSLLAASLWRACRFAKRRARCNGFTNARG